jgi:3',5'-cyclic AMP phosphodiesterase CpdA
VEVLDEVPEDHRVVADPRTGRVDAKARLGGHGWQDDGVPRPYVLVQISDPHLGATWGGDADPDARLASTVAAVRELRTRPDAVLVSGDLADHGSAEEYARGKELLGSIGAPVHVLPGNHDDRAELRRAFGLADLNRAEDLGPLRLVCLDSTIPGEDGGQLDAGWLDAALAEAPDTPTIVAFHHAPLVTGVPEADEIGLPNADRQRLADVLARHAQVRCLAAGHIHWVMFGSLGGRRVVVAPSTYVQARLDLGDDTRDIAAQPAGFVVHALRDGDVISYLQAVVA